MKKSRILLCIAASLFAMAAARAASDTRTAAEYRAIADQMIAVATNAAACKAIAVTNSFWVLSSRKDLTDFRLGLDEEFASAGIAGPIFDSVSWPRLSAAQRESLGITTSMPIRVALGTKYRCNLYSWQFRMAGATPEELVMLLDESLYNVYVLNRPWTTLVEADKMEIQKGMEKSIRKLLRQQGKSFVTKNGVNPCQTYMDRLTTALNAPRLAGLNDWLAEMGIAASVDVSYLPAEAAVTALKNKILDGEQSLTTKDKNILTICLGVDGYNAFVKEYNGD